MKKPSKYIRVVYYLCCTIFFVLVLFSIAALSNLDDRWYELGMHHFLSMIKISGFIFFAFITHKAIYQIFYDLEQQSIDQQYNLKVNKIFYHIALLSGMLSIAYLFPCVLSLICKFIPR